MSAVLARRYARAFFDIGTVRKKATQFQLELEGVAAAIRCCPELGIVLIDPDISITKRERVIDALREPLGISAITGNFLKVLIQKRRMGQFPEIVTAFGQYVAELEQVVTAEVTTTIPLTDPGLVQQIERTIGAVFQRKVVVQTQTNPSLIGGMVIRVGDEVFDGSMAAELRRVRERLVHT